MEAEIQLPLEEVTKCPHVCPLIRSWLIQEGLLASKNSLLYTILRSYL